VIDDVGTLGTTVEMNKTDINTLKGTKTEVETARNGAASLDERLKGMEKANNRQKWTVTATTQTRFTLTNGSYTVGSKSFKVYIEGVLQPEDAYTQVSSTIFDMIDPVPQGVTVMAEWLEGKVPVQFGHNTTHYTGGQDPLDVTKLANYQAEVADKIGSLIKKGDHFISASSYNSLQDAINALEVANPYLLSTNGKGGKLVIPRGVYTIDSPLTTNLSSIEIEGVGNVVIRASNSFTGDSLLKVGDQKTTYDVKIKNITFTKINANPYDGSTYDSSTYKSGVNYDFSSSVRGLSLEDVHHYEIENCKFIGLKLGLQSRGAWSGVVKRCRFEYNNRHMQTGNNANGSQATNFFKIEDCVFGAAVLNGGVTLIDTNTLSLNNNDFENNHHVPLYLKQCRLVTVNGAHFESNAKYSRSEYDTNFPTASFVYSTTAFKTTTDDNCPKIYDGYHIVADACHSIEIRNAKFTSLSAGGEKGHFLNVFGQDSIKFENCQFDGGLGSGSVGTKLGLSAFCQKYDTADTASVFIFENCISRPIWKLHDVVGSVVKDTHLSKNGNYFMPETYYVDLTNGNDDIHNDEMNTTNRLKNLRQLWMCLPQDSRITYTVYVKGNNSGGTMGLYNTPVNGGTFKLIGDDTMNSQLNTTYLPPIANGYVYMEKVTMSYLVQEVYGSTVDYLYGSGMLHLKNSTIDGNYAGGSIVSKYGGKYLLDNVTINQQNGVSFSTLVQNGQEMWLKGGAFNKPVKVRDFGRVFYQNVATNPPVVDTGYMGVVTTIT